MKLSVCIDAIFHGRDFCESMKEVKKSGISAIEFWSWWDKDTDAIRSESEKLGLTVATFCTKFISLVDPAQHDAYLEGLQESIQTAKKLRCSTLISQTGADTGRPREEQLAALIKGLKKCVPCLEQNNITLVVEPLNTKIDHAGYFLSHSDEAFKVIQEVGSDHVKLLFDIYHQQITEGDVTRTLRENIAKIGHFHAAGNPGRHELDTGELNYPYLFSEIKNSGYEGFVGLEYFPESSPADGLLYAGKIF
jgi:Hydroxypyruvate isomerase